MGEVYRATDLRLKRDVALKVLPAALADDPSRMARFQREAEVLASLNHANIAQIYGLEESEIEPGNSVRAIVMELVEGETLAEIINRGPLPIETAISYAKQIASAFEYAHDKSKPVIHRDLKPANVQVTPDGMVKVLDFGLAKALADEPSESVSSLANSPTLTMGPTVVGMILGTAAYMSPEQAKGKPVDRRTDIWSFGVLLYEMVTGIQLFKADDAAEILASIVLTEPKLDAVPARLRTAIARCLRKDPRKRWYSMEDVRFALDESVSEPKPAPADVTPLPAARPKSIWARLALGLTALLFLAAGAAAVWFLKPSPTLNITKFPITLGEGQAFTNTGRLDLAMSPDGTQMVYVVNRRLYIRSMAELEARPIPVAESPGGVTNPVLSPDGKSVAFWSVSDTSIKRVAVSGGAPVTICPAQNLLGMSWSEEGIVFGDGGKNILRVSPNGGKPEALVAAKDNELIADPQMLPGGQAVLFGILQGGKSGKMQLVAQTLKSGARKTLVEDGGAPRYLPSGHLAYSLNGVLFAIPFDAKRLETGGDAVGVVEGVARAATTGETQFAFSNTGSMIYIPGPVSTVSVGQSVLGLVDRKGDVEPLKVPPGAYLNPRISRDGKRVAYQMDEGKDASIWIWELSGVTAPRRLTLPGSGANRAPIWSSDNQRVAFQSDREGDLGIWWQRADGNGTAERLTRPDKGVADVPDSWAPDGQTFSFTEEKTGASEVWTYSLHDKKATVLAATPGTPLGKSVFSPDGRWVAYQLNAQPNSRIYVRPFPRTETEFVAPVDGDSHHPVWSPDGKELMYVSGASQSGSMSITTQPSVSFGSPVHAPRAGFNTQVPASVRTFDILPDGKHFIGVVAAGTSQAGGGAGQPQIQVVLNWFEDVKSRAPGK
jgi:serine/threonine-protein kinase